MSEQQTQNNLLNSVSIGTASDLMYAVIHQSFKQKTIPGNICIVGAPGTAKSAAVWQLAQRLEEDFKKPCEVIDLRLAGMDSSDVQGIPYVSESGRTTKYFDHNGIEREMAEKDMFFSTPNYWPRDTSKNYILFLDELLNAPAHVQHAAYRLILDRTCQNGTKLPDNVAIVAAGNRKEDKTGAKPLLPAAANRFAMHLLIDQNAAADEFISYMMNTGFDRTIVGFLAYKRDAIYQPPNDVESAFPTQRSWDFADKHVKNPAINGSDHMLRISIASAVGNAQATDYMGFREHYGKLPDWRKIRAGEITYTIPQDDEGLKFAISSALAAELLDAYRIEDRAQSTKEVNALCDVFKQAPSEMKVVTFKMIKSDTSAAMKFVNYPRVVEIFEEVASKLKR